MREAAFVTKNYDRWKEFEVLLTDHRKSNPDKLAELFIQITDDLAYAQTRYPESKTTQYLNSLAYKIHQAIYKNKKESSQRFITFWQYELPQLMFGARKELLYAFVIFSLSIVIGALSAAHDETFVRLILGDGYVNMTLENIEKGEPMGVYGSMGEANMFAFITFNNIRVSFLVFVAGLFFSFGTGFLLFNNGVMLGAFQYFFYQKGLFLTSFLTIWIHGTLEISSIIIAGASGLVLGNSILFPGTYSRMESFKRGAVKGLKMVIGLVPVFILAGFLESFVTRNTHWPVPVKAGIILLSALFIIYYFIVYPIKLQSHAKYPTDQAN